MFKGEHFLLIFGKQLIFFSKKDFGEKLIFLAEIFLNFQQKIDLVCKKTSFLANLAKNVF